MKKKAQAGMFEIIVVLFVFFLLIGFGLIFYAGMQKRSSTEDSKRVLELRAVRVAQIASTLPELQCSLDNAVRENCIEVEKAMAAKDVIEKNIADYALSQKDSRLILDDGNIKESFVNGKVVIDRDAVIDEVFRKYYKGNDIEYPARIKEEMKGISKDKLTKMVGEIRNNPKNFKFGSITYLNKMIKMYNNPQIPKFTSPFPNQNMLEMYHLPSQKMELAPEMMIRNAN